MGLSGTGKTFLLLAKLKQLQEHKLLKSDAKALVIVAATQESLYWDLTEKLSPFGNYVLIDRVKYPLGVPVFASLKELLEKTTDVKFIFVDQMEDLISNDTDFMIELSLLSKDFNEKFRLMWVLWNGKGATSHIFEDGWSRSDQFIKEVSFLNDAEQLYGKGEFAGRMLAFEKNVVS